MSLFLHDKLSQLVRTGWALLPEPLECRFGSKSLLQKPDGKLTVWFDFQLLAAGISKEADTNAAVGC